MEEAKRWYASRTIWTNAVALVASVLGTAGVDLPVDQQGAIVTMILAAVNIGLRLDTDRPLSK